VNRVFVTGGTGVVGRRTVPALLGAGHDVSVVVRSEEAAARVAAAGAAPVRVDLFDPDAVRAAVEGHDAVVNLATAIPTGASAVRPSAWRANDRLRTEASRHLADAVPDGGRYIGESITFPYADGGTGWVDESADRIYVPQNESVRDSESAAASVAGRGGIGVSLRFAMFWAPDSAHIESLAAAARRGWWLLPGAPDGVMSWIDVDDAARAVVAALTAPAGVYNVGEGDPRPRSEHADALARVVGRSRLRTLPRWTERLGGPGAESLTRSHRISSQRLTDATGWKPEIEVIGRWADVGTGG